MRNVSRAVLGPVLVLLTLLCGGCGEHGVFGVSEPTTIVSSDGKSKLVVPEGFRSDDSLHDDAELEVSNIWEENYLVVLTESKLDFDDITVDEHSELTLGILLDSLGNARVEKGPKELEIHGRRALQYEVRGSIDGLRVVYLHTTVNGEDSFHQIVAWTLPSKFKENGPKMRKMIESFEEV